MIIFPLLLCIVLITIVSVVITISIVTLTTIAIIVLTFISITYQAPNMSRTVARASSKKAAMDSCRLSAALSWHRGSCPQIGMV